MDEPYPLPGFCESRDMIRLTCSICATAFEVPESRIGASAHCPNCQAAVPVLAVSPDTPPVRVTAPGEFAETAKRTPTAATTATEPATVSDDSSEILARLVGKKLGPYSIRKVLGRGGMGIVFEGEDSGLHRSAAIKVMSSNNGKDRVNRERFLREADCAGSLDHENIVPVWYSGEERGILFMAMPLLQGRSLEDRLLEEGVVPWMQALHIVRECAAGLSFAHKAGLIHRDIKPGNIFLETRADHIDGFRVRILDFGLAMVVEGAHLTQSGLVVGTPAWMAPEQASDEEDVDGRADLFSLGCVMYQMLTGNKPFRGRDVLKIFNALANHHPPAPRIADPKIPREVSDLNLQLLEKSPSMRPESAAVLVELCRELALRLQVCEAPVAIVRLPYAGKLMLIGGIVGSVLTAIVTALVYRHWFDD